MRNHFQTFLVAFAILTGISRVNGQGTTAFTFQGRLNTVGGAAGGSYDMTFAVWDAGAAGNRIAGPVTNSAVAVSNGLFIVTLDFGAGVFTGTNYFVEMAVRTNGGGTFSTLAPRQQLTPAPYALSLISPQATALCPPGSVMAYMGTTAPNGWLLCNGISVSRTEYAALFSVIGTNCGNGDGSTTFHLPDLRGRFLRGVDSGSLRDPDAASRTAMNPGGNTGSAVGSVEPDALKSHSHPLTSTVYVHFRSFTGQDGTDKPLKDSGGSVFMTQTASAGGTETRPVNAAVNYIIKY